MVNYFKMTYRCDPIRLLLIFIMAFSAVLNVEARQTEDAFVRCSISKSEFYCRECVTAVFWLYSTNSDIAYVREVQPAALNNGQFSYITNVSELPRPRTERIKGKEYVAYPIAMSIMAIDKSGKYDLSGAVFNVGYNVPVEHIDPYYGRIRTVQTIEKNLTMKPVHFKVLELPRAEEDFAFSGAVGKFSIDVSLPPGDIIVNEDATVLITLSGEGLIENDVLPEYHDAFGVGNKLKSFTESHEFYFNGKQLVSRKNLECIFVPSEINDCLIGIVRFGYFNPETKSYETAESSPFKVDVKSSAIKVKPVYI